MTGSQNLLKEGDMAKHSIASEFMYIICLEICGYIYGYITLEVQIVNPNERYVNTVK